MSAAVAASALIWLSVHAYGGDAAELQDAWAAYQKVYISADGRVMDFREDGVTTSEGQAYAMVRALWMGDRASFDRVLRWTVEHLQRGDEGRLAAWRWGRRDDGTDGILDEQPASDADQLMIWALFGAATRWKSPRYQSAAHAQLERLWVEEVTEVAGRLVLLPGPWARGGVPLRLNPSYFLPFAWREFARRDPDRPWMRLVDDGYTLLAACRSPGGLHHDWCSIDPVTGTVVAAVDAADEVFGFEAFRVGWTLAAEVKWFHERRARRLLGPYEKLLARPEAPVKIPGIILADGRAGVDWEYPGMWGALLPAWGLRHPGVARRIWTEKLVPLRTSHGWGDPDDYYGQNWIWFGLALWQSKERPV
ncbi:MAG: hypothetical protein EXR71_04785 [Myxococcales bacterium]|nr:hypothetical protein [Myxococcales bacterium]